MWVPRHHGTTYARHLLSDICGEIRKKAGKNVNQTIPGYFQPLVMSSHSSAFILHSSNLIFHWSALIFHSSGFIFTRQAWFFTLHAWVFTRWTWFFTHQTWFFTRKVSHSPTLILQSDRFSLVKDEQLSGFIYLHVQILFQTCNSVSIRCTFKQTQSVHT